MEKFRMASALLMSSMLAADLPKPPRPTDPCAAVNIIAAAERQTRRDGIHAFVPEIEHCSSNEIRDAARFLSLGRIQDEEWATEYVLWRTAREQSQRDALAERE